MYVLIKQEFHKDEDEELSRAVALSLEMQNNQPKTTGIKVKTQRPRLSHGGS